MVAWFAFFVLVIVGLAHSWLGEAKIIGPLLRTQAWQIGVPRGPADRILRFAWHLTTVAWLGLGAALLGLSPSLAFGLTCLVSSLIIFCALRAHLAWPLFGLAGLLGLHAGGVLPDSLRVAVVGASVAIAVGAAGLHAYWAFGGRAGFGRVVPEGPDGRPRFEPGALACLAVTAALLVFAGIVAATAAGVGPGWLAWLDGLALALLVIRAIGDRDQVGFTKRARTSAFARADDALYTPLVVLLALGAAVALLPA